MILIFVSLLHNWRISCVLFAGPVLSVATATGRNAAFVSPAAVAAAGAATCVHAAAEWYRVRRLGAAAGAGTSAPAAAVVVLTVRLAPA